MAGPSQRQEPRSYSGLLTQAAGTQVLEPLSVASQMQVSMKLDCEAELALEPRHSDMEFGTP